jgi:murein DD-endopeptidase MepM/ murein hydrolase activator NlpD
MPRRHWTLLFITDGAGDIKQFRVPRVLVQLAIGAALVVVSSLSSVGTAFVMKARAPKATHELEVKNALLKRELNEIRDQVGVLHTQMDSLAYNDEQFRLVAGLEPIEHDVQRVGIGGSLVKASDKKLFQLDPEATAMTVQTFNDVGELLRRAKLLNFSWREARDSLLDKHHRLESTPSIIPTYGYITSAFSRSRKHPILDRARPHEGIDISARHGTPIFAAAKGRVRFAGKKGDFGMAVEIDHGYGVVTRYAHASKLLVRNGQSVKRGDTIAQVGSTGLAVGPHLHYEVLVNGRPQNPGQYVLNTNRVAD